MATELTCPTCGTLSYLPEVTRNAAAFCRVCDYPLFWARSAQLAGPGSSEGEEGLRRLPGTAGLLTVATIACPSCAEPNPITGSICIRCGADLRPPPPEPPPPPPVVVEPVVVPAPPSRRAWPWPLLVAAAVVAIVLIVVFGFVY